MAEIIFDHISLAYPLLGGGVRRKLNNETLKSAGAVVKDTTNRGRSVVALSDITLHLQDGDRVGLIGRNGSGKSTLLRVAAGIYEPLTGNVSISGTIASLFSVGLGMKPDATGYRNIELSALIAGFSKEEIQEQRPRIAEFSELGEYLDMPVRTYSNGMAMRLKFACATAFSPNILLMDEWLGAGDPAFQAKAQKRMRTLVEDAGILMLASHNHKQLAAECNKAIWLDKGVMKAFGPVKEVIEQAESAVHEIISD